MKHLVVAAAAFALCVHTVAVAAVDREPAGVIEANARALLDAYAAGNRAAVIKGLGREVHVYGSDRSEVASTPAGFMALYDTDQKLWRGGASFGPMQNVSLVTDGRLASLFFDRPFSVGGQATVVRFATVWRLEDGSWKLVQSVNVVPTTGQSGAELLAGARK